MGLHKDLWKRNTSARPSSSSTSAMQQDLGRRILSVQSEVKKSSFCLVCGDSLEQSEDRGQLHMAGDAWKDVQTREKKSEGKT